MKCEELDLTSGFFFPHRAQFTAETDRYCGDSPMQGVDYACPTGIIVLEICNMRNKIQKLMKE